MDALVIGLAIVVVLVMVVTGVVLYRSGDDKVHVTAERLHFVPDYPTPSTWVDLGRSTGVKRDEVVAYGDGYDPFPRDQTLLRQDLASKVRAMVLLRNGKLVPCYVTVETLEKRLGTTK